MFRPLNANYKTRVAPKKVSTAFKKGQAVVFDTDGFLVPADASSTAIVGVTVKAVISTDEDYADATPLQYIVADSVTEFLADVSTGTAAATNRGEYVDLHADGDGVDVTASSVDAFAVTAIKSSSLVVGVFNKRLV